MTEKAQNNKFLTVEDAIRANAIVKPERYEKIALYILLYNEIEGSLDDYQGTRHELDVLIDKRIGDVMRIINKIYDNRELGLPDEYGITDAENLAFAKSWMNRILPVSNDPANVSADKKYVSDFIRDYDAVKAEKDRLLAVTGNTNGYFNLQEGLMLLDAKRTKVRELYERARRNCDYKPGKIGKDGKPESGIHADDYFAAENELKKKQRLLRRKMGKGGLKLLGALAFAALTVVSAGTVLSFGGFALTAVFGTTFSAAAATGLGATGLGVLGSVFGFYGSKNLFKRFRKDWAEILKMREEIKDFKGPAYIGKDLEVFLAAAGGKDGKGKTLNEKNGYEEISIFKDGVTL